MIPPPFSRPKPAKSRAWLVAVGILLLLVFGFVWMMGAGKNGSVKRVAHANPELQGAARRAQAELDSFVSQLAVPKPGERFAIKGAFPTPVGPEYLWVKDPRYASGKFTGTLDQPPIAYHGAGKGDQVTVARADVFDWMIKDGDETRGGYTEQALANQQRGQ